MENTLAIIWVDQELNEDIEYSKLVSYCHPAGKPNIRLMEIKSTYARNDKVDYYLNVPDRMPKWICKCYDYNYYSNLEMAKQIAEEKIQETYNEVIQWKN